MRKIYVIFNPDSCMPFLFDDKKEALKAQQNLRAQCPEFEWKIYEQIPLKAEEVIY